ncbi:STAS domain-containing protein [Streptomyces sp. NPDC018610]|jgi:anti-sigma B factor antagonist|uniref:STAS domain-containing protein n=1 Tax=Streptomyces sp. NPDC018610 TaxID=3365049 RepID=UPI0037A514EC
MSKSHTWTLNGHTERTVGGATVVTLSGDVGFATRLSLGARLDALSAGPRPDLVLDLRGVPFIDCAGLGLLCRVRNRVAARDGRLRLVSDSAFFRRILRRTGLSGVFQVVPEFAGTPAAGRAPAERPVVPAGQD